METGVRRSGQYKCTNRKTMDVLVEMAIRFYPYLQFTLPVKLVIGLIYRCGMREYQTKSWNKGTERKSENCFTRRPAVAN